MQSSRVAAEDMKHSCKHLDCHELSNTQKMMTTKHFDTLKIRNYHKESEGEQRAKKMRKK